jgi:periplasmic protein TonB
MLAVAGTLAIHVIALTAGDALVVTHPPRPLVVAPRVELVEIEPPPVLAPAPPPVPAPDPPSPPPDEVKPPPRPQAARPVAPPTRAAAEPPPPPPSDPRDPGGDPVVQMDDIAPAATGVAVAPGKPTAGHLGRGGTGGGTGSGSGSGAGDAPQPVSVATLKSPAMPKAAFANDYSKDYPPEAKTLGIEGTIRVRLLVDDTGRVQARVLLNRLGHGLDELAMKRALEIEFEPARDTDDKPVASTVIWTFTFNLPK